MQTEIDQAVIQLSRDLSQDYVTIHYRTNGGGREEVSAGFYTSGTRASMVFTVSTITSAVYVEIEETDWQLGPDEEGRFDSTTRRIPLEDVYDVEVDSFGDEPDYSGPPSPYSRWLRNRNGVLLRLDLT